MAEAAKAEILESTEQDVARPFEAVPAREYYDFAIFEAQAAELINNHESIEHDNWSGEQQINGRTALWEALTAKGHLSRVVHGGNGDERNKAILLRLLNAWSNELPQWEKDRRFYEIVEELLVQQVELDIEEGLLPPDTKVLTISDRPEEATGPVATQIGYRELNDKGMVRTHGFEQDEYGQLQRVLEQIPRSNSNDGSSEVMLQSMGAKTDGTGLKRLANQVLISGVAFPNGVVDVQRALDNYAGPFVRYGEDLRGADFNCPDYDKLREVSSAREQHFAQFSQRLENAEVCIDLDYKNGHMSYNEKLQRLQIEREKLINEICLIDPSYALDARGELSASYFRKANLAMVNGDDNTGQQHFESAIRSVDPRASVVCGGTGVEAAIEGLAGEGKQMYRSAKEARENWQWTKGHCAINSCPTRPDKTEVGPCRVCRGCQQLFDDGMELKDIQRKYEKSAGRAVRFSALDIFVNAVRTDGVVVRIRRLARRQQASDNEWEQRRLQKIIGQESRELEQLQRVA